jgi:hypothetical protein
VRQLRGDEGDTIDDLAEALACRLAREMEIEQRWRAAEEIPAVDFCAGVGRNVVYST